MYKTLSFWWCPIGGNWVVVTRTAVLRLYMPSITPWGHFLLKYKFLLQRNCHWWAISIKLNSTAGLKKSRCIHNFVTYKSNLYSRRWNIKTLIASTFSNSSMQKYTMCKTLKREKMNSIRTSYYSQKRKAWVSPKPENMRLTHH